MYNDDSALDLLTESKGISLDIEMEAPITVDQIKRSGGLGATDDIIGFVPGAIDSSDFESFVLHAKEFEGLTNEKHRSGLGYEADLRSQEKLEQESRARDQ